jgi:Mce-associated membrane protein
MTRDLKEPESATDEQVEPAATTADAEPEAAAETEAEPDAKAAVDAEAKPAKEKPAKAPRPMRLALPVAIGLSVLLVVSIAAAVTFGLLLKAKNDTDAAASEALNTARSFAVTLTTYDYNNLDKNFADVLDGSTGDFKNEYTGGSSTLRQLLQQAKATSRGTVLDAGVKSATTDRVEIVLVANQAVTNAAIKEGETRVDRSRFLMTMEKHDGRWLVASVRML